VHRTFRKASFTPAKIAENAKTLLHALQSAKPASAKGQYMQSVTLTSTMGPGVKVDPSQKFE
jgi:large subunit ribosomal protein L1